MTDDDAGALDRLDEAIAVALSARSDVLATRSSAELIDLLDRAAGRWRRNEGGADSPAAAPDPARAKAERELAGALALDPDMIRHGLDLIFSAVDRRALEALVAEDCAAFASSPTAAKADAPPEPLSPGATRRLGDGRRLRLLGPRLTIHALAGNVPGLSIPVIAAAVLARSAVVIRDSRRQPVLSAAFVATLAELDPLVARTIVLAPPDVAVEALAARAHEHGARVEISGSDAAVERLAAVYRGAVDDAADSDARAREGAADVHERHRTAVEERDVVERGTRASVVVATAGARADDWVDRIAHDAVMYEGLGCLTPHTLIVETSEGAAGRGSTSGIDGDQDLDTERACKRAWIDALAAAFERFQQRWPRVPQAMALERERRGFLERAELARAVSADTLTVIGPDEAWCILHSDETASVGIGPGLRCLSVVASRSRTQTVGLLRSSVVPMAGVGLTLNAGDAAFDEIQETLVAESGATLICAVGQMQAPPLCWPQDGRRRLGDLLDWRDDETPIGNTALAQE